MALRWWPITAGSLNGKATLLTVCFMFLPSVLCKNSSQCVAELQNDTLQLVYSHTGETLTLAEAVGLIVGFGVFAALIAEVFSLIRKKVFKDKENLDSFFDAGGKVSVGLTATTIVSKWTWAATLLQSSTVASKYGVSGPLWYAAGATVQIILFAILSIQLKIRAPGAKTFLQVTHARFGLKTHSVFCAFALLTNIIVTAMLMLGGAAVLTSLVDGLSVELAAMILAAVIGGYSYIGGLGGTFYVSYFNTALIFIITLIFVIKIYNSPDDEDNPLGSAERVFELLNCAVGPDENKDNSYLTFLSSGGLMFGVINLVGNFGTVFVDQSYWQSSVAAKPRQGVWGFITGGLAWFAVPFTFATTLGLAYVALSTANGEELLSDADVDAGLIPPTIAQSLMGRSGAFLMTLMILMAVTSTGSAEVMAVTSILVYDLYQLHWRPYRRVTDSSSCILCDKQRGRVADIREQCNCYSMAYCKQCADDDRARLDTVRGIKPAFSCSMHGSYRMYLDMLIHKKNWCILWVSITIVPLILILQALQVSLGWVYLFMGVLIGSAVVPIALSIFWSRLTGPAMVSGAVSGTVLGIISWIAVASTYEGGLRGDMFLENTGKEVSMLVGNCVAIGSGAIITFIVTWATNYNLTATERKETWEKTLDIDNPLVPWAELYARELSVHDVKMLNNRPTLESMEGKFKTARKIAIFTAILLTLIIIIAWPAGMIALQVMDFSQFSAWILASQIWAWIAAIFLIVVPVVNEIYTIATEPRESRRKRAIVHAGYSNGAYETGRNMSTAGVQTDMDSVETGADGAVIISDQQIELKPY
ncbi:uncharacterized protein [Ptychodera flava]|uniref:uncharacterized protein n=1 Tax=Ptychodera flava TaxID=63121 RepID=UPI00396A8DBC